MKLVASVICRNELGRYLEPFIAHLLEFCDEVRVLDDGSTDGTAEWLTDRLRGGTRLGVMKVPEGRFFAHEGRARQRLLEWTLAAEPTHILAVDADEFVCDGAALRSTLEREIAPSVWNLCMLECWHADADGLRIRQDGGWAEHDVPIVYAPGRLPGLLQIPDRALASGRTPTATRGPRASHSGTGILHWGWVNESERVARHHRYAVADGGRFHASSHLDSILWPDSQVKLVEWGWPEALLPYKEQILERSNRVVGPV